ncbi:MAG: multi-sensor signal transduction histidine kinase [Proteobacteria bacterium]|nr:multi-sensor signal transduction histidine kinase [Pseudomonadota bacterium]
MSTSRFHRLLPPRSLHRQFLLVSTVLSLLILGSGLTAIYALRSSAEKTRQLAEERLVRMQDGQDIAQRTLLIERECHRMLTVAGINDARISYAEIIRQLGALDGFVERLAQASDNVAVLEFQDAGQSFRNTVHIVAHLQEDVERARSVFDQALQTRAAALDGNTRPAALALNLIFNRLRDETNPGAIAELREQYRREVEGSKQFPRVLVEDARSPDNTGRQANAGPFGLRLKLLEQQDTLQQFDNELQRRALAMVNSGRGLSMHITEDYRAAIEELLTSARSKQYWVLALLVSSLLLAWLISKYFMARHVLARLQEVSRHLRGSGSQQECSQIPVQGSDEIAEMARAVERLLEDRRRLAETNEELEAFSYSVSHDLRTPLRAINGFAHILKDTYSNRLDEKAHHYLSVINRNSIRMGQLIDDLLEFSRMARRQLVFTRINLAPMAHEVFEELRGSVPERKLTLRLGDLPLASGDRAMIRQVVTNLFANAVKFTANRDEAIIELDGFRAGDESIYRVKDNGVGFDMQYVGKLFGVFQRLHGVDEFEGTGIGLAIVKRIIDRHGGRVWAEGKLDAGATLYFTLPPCRSVDDSALESAGREK